MSERTALAEVSRAAVSAAAVALAAAADEIMSSSPTDGTSFGQVYLKQESSCVSQFSRVAG